MSKSKSSDSLIQNFLLAIHRNNHFQVKIKYGIKKLMTESTFVNGIVLRYFVGLFTAQRIKAVDLMELREEMDESIKAIS